MLIDSKGKHHKTLTCPYCGVKHGDRVNYIENEEEIKRFADNDIVLPIEVKTKTIEFKLINKKTALYCPDCENVFSTSCERVTE